MSRFEWRKRLIRHCNGVTFHFTYNTSPFQRHITIIFNPLYIELSWFPVYAPCLCLLLFVDYSYIILLKIVTKEAIFTSAIFFLLNHGLLLVHFVVKWRHDGTACKRHGIIKQKERKWAGDFYPTKWKFNHANSKNKNTNSSSKHETIPWVQVNIR